MTTRHNGTPASSRAKRRLTALLKVLQTLDVTAFRGVTGAVDATDDQILEAIHKTRLEHPGVNYSMRTASRRWLEENGT